VPIFVPNDYYITLELMFAIESFYRIRDFVKSRIFTKDVFMRLFYVLIKYSFATNGVKK
jgi:hypothetical protein